MEQINQSLSEFYQVAQDYGFSRDYQARVTELTINGNTLVDGVVNGVARPLLYIKNFSTPSIKRVISTVKYDGVDIHAVGQKTYSDSANWDVTFYCDQMLFIKEWFQNRLIESASNTPGRINYNPVPGGNSFATIDVINDNLESVTKYKLNGLFIIDVPGIGYDMAGNGKVQEMRVKFGYQTWTSTVSNPSRYGLAQEPGKKDLLTTIIGGLNTISETARAVRGVANATRGAATAIRGAGRAIRGR